MGRTTLAFLWHMHQPYYRDMATGESTMPWARLHGIHSYYDMMRLYERFPAIKGTINFVPSLVEQLLAYAEKGQSDAFLDHTLIPAEALTPEQKAFLLRYFFMANPDRKIAPHANYQKLFARRGLDPLRIDFQQAIRFFSTQDYLDLQVYYNLVWFGFAARQEMSELGQMLAHGGHFTEEDKLFAIDAQRRVIKNLLDALRRAGSLGNVEICTTPYFHPIFPLLIDTSFARRAMPSASLPPDTRLPAIAKAQLEGALDAMEGWTGTRPAGIWPAEGGVCPEMIPIAADAGVRWMASDDRVLARSLQKDAKDISPHQPFAAAHGGKKVDIVFRDHELSDLISFTYSGMPAMEAVANFIGHIKRIGAAAGGEDRLVTVILDGENPWEFYPESGREFLTALFEALEAQDIPTDTIGGYLRTNPPQRIIDRLHTGSWIDANFAIWIGRPQKNTAWTYIRRTIDEVGPDLIAKRHDDPKASRAFDSLCAACGSDWFWWYDDDFDSAFKPDYDRIFRMHLKNAFSLIGLDVPLYLFEPIYRFAEPKGELAEPAGLMNPVIDGQRTSFFEWANALRYNVRGRGGAMALAAEPFVSISFGFNPECFFLRIDPAEGDAGFTLADDEGLVFHIHDGGKHFKFGLKREGGGFGMAAMKHDGDPSPAGCPIRWKAGKVLEMAVPFVPLGFSAGESVTVAVALHRHGIEVRRYSHIHFIVPDNTYEQRMWSV